MRVLGRDFELEERFCNAMNAWFHTSARSLWPTLALGSLIACSSEPDASPEAAQDVDAAGSDALSRGTDGGVRSREDAGEGSDDLEQPPAAASADGDVQPAPITASHSDSGLPDAGSLPDLTGMLSGSAASPAVDAISDVNRETGVPPNEEDRDAAGRPIARTRVRLRLEPTATVGDVNAALDDLDGEIVMSVARFPLLLVKIPDPGSVEALEALVARAAGHPGMRSVVADTLSKLEVLPTNFQATPPTEPDLTKIDHLLAARFAAAWNARGAIIGTDVPQVVIVDAFGNGAPDTGVAASFTTSDFGTANADTHGYHVAGTALGHFGGTQLCDLFPATVNGERDCVVGAMPTTSNLPRTRVIDIRKGLTLTGRQMALRQLLDASVGHVVVNESLGFPCVEGASPHCETVEFSREVASDWVAMVRGLRPESIGDGFESRVLHVASAGNVSYGFDVREAATKSFHNAAALLPGLEDILAGPIPNLTNTLVVENTIATERAPFAVSCLNAASFVGGHLSAVGTNVWSFVSPSLAAAKAAEADKREFEPNVGADDNTGTSMSAPQVAGLATFIWSLAPALTAPEVSKLLVSTAQVTAGSQSSSSCDEREPAPPIDAYEAVLSLDTTLEPTPETAPIRHAILDVNDDGAFDEGDLVLYQSKLVSLPSGKALTAEMPDYSRFDLNGDGYTGLPPVTGLEPAPSSFDLDRATSTPFGRPVFSVVSREIEGVSITFDEHDVGDIEILCYYGYSELYEGSASVRSDLLGKLCGPSVEPQGAVLAPGESVAFEMFAFGETVEATWESEGGSVTSDGLFTASEVEGVFLVHGTSVSDSTVTVVAEVTVESGLAGEDLLIAGTYFGLLDEVLYQEGFSGIYRTYDATYTFTSEGPGVTGTWTLVEVVGPSEGYTQTGPILNGLRNGDVVTFDHNDLDPASYLTFATVATFTGSGQADSVSIETFESKTVGGASIGVQSQGTLFRIDGP